MNVPLIEKLIKSNNETCPEIAYSNPLLDKNVTRALSRSFVKILNTSKENDNQNLRLAVLKNIRKTCKVEPDEHVKIDENLTELVTRFYEKHNRDTSNSFNIDKKLDAFLIRRSKEFTVRALYPSRINPEIAQALINLNEKEALENGLIKDIIHWNQDDKKSFTVIKELWCNQKIYEDNISECDSINILDDASIKIKEDIEKSLLEMLLYFIENKNVDTDGLLKINNFYKIIINVSSVSPECFQICINILNSVFILSNFNLRLQEFIVEFIDKVKITCSKVTFAVLYPSHLMHVVTLLDFCIENLPLYLKQNYIKETVNYLKMLHSQNEIELVLVLSHFPVWFDIYYEH